MDKKMLITGFFLLLLVISFPGCVEEKSKTIYVDDGGGADFNKIQYAIDNAIDGDTVFVYNGTYYESIIINKSLNLIGENKNQTIIYYKKNSYINKPNVIEINANNVTIKNLQIISSVTSSGKVGINIHTSYNTISNNILINNYNGINISKGTKNNILSLNTISNSRLYGISISSSKNNNISRNNVSLSGFYGIYLTLSDNNIIFRNNITKCDFYGVRIKASEKNTVYLNTIFNNTRGIYLCCGSTNNIIYYNIIKENIEWNAHDEDFNQWDNGIIGNYWDDYNGTDSDGNGIGDISYNIIDGYGDFNNKDRYPLMNKFDI